MVNVENEGERVIMRRVHACQQRCEDDTRTSANTRPGCMNDNSDEEGT
jgi:hypothetical protein